MRRYGNPTNEDVFPQIFDDAIYAWKTDEFEGESVFQAQDPGGMLIEQTSGNVKNDASAVSDQPVEPVISTQSEVQGAGIRIELSRIGGQ
ncbi:hypothetical protein [Rhizobium sp. R693]|uniref:hypothetical protein n=1 Tax=Rhizobium sp. R693 TaxID=1764276 RepID=UPI000B529D6C|nr:hypothetical protein [Rhizobium sp. R693]